MPHFWQLQPTDAASMIAFAIGALAFFATLFWTRLRTAAPDAGEKRSARSMVGVLVQGFGMALGGGPQRIVAPVMPLRTLAVVLCMTATVGLFVWATRTMGDNWAIVARTRGDHQLVTTGPFAWVRNPIYVAMAFFMFGLSFATGHAMALIVALPVFAIGTTIRINEEERLLRAHFGGAYDAYAARVKRFVPNLF